ncbi:MAG: DUF3969 family protein [Fuerstiella sp.]
MKINNDKRVLVSLVILGVCDALKTQSISILEAERLVFSPFMMKACDDCGPDLVEAIHRGTELDDINDLIPQNLQEVIGQIERLAARVLKEQVSSPSFGDTRWIDLLS